MKTITTIFESILGQDDTFVWTPTDGPTEFARGWAWGGPIEGPARGWHWGGPIDGV